LIPVYQPVSDLGYKPKAVGEKNSYGLMKFAKTIEVFLIANTELTQTQIMQLKDEDWVFIGKQKNGQNVVFGYERGLSLKTTSQDLNSTDTHGGILLTFDENAVNYPMLFTSDFIYSLPFYYSLINNGTIANGGTVHLSIDIDKTGYVFLPNGTMLTTIGGLIDTTYSGVGGKITYIIPKNAVVAILTGGYTAGDVVTDFAGELAFGGNSFLTSITANNTTSLICNDCALLTTISVNKADVIEAPRCHLTDKAIADIIIAAANEPTVQDVVFDFTEYANATYGSVFIYANTNYGIDLNEAYFAANFTTHDITFNE